MKFLLMSAILLNCGFSFASHSMQSQDLIAPIADVLQPQPNPIIFNQIIPVIAHQPVNDQGFFKSRKEAAFYALVTLAAGCMVAFSFRNEKSTTNQSPWLLGVALSSGIAAYICDSMD